MVAISRLIFEFYYHNASLELLFSRDAPEPSLGLSELKFELFRIYWTYPDSIVRFALLNLLQETRLASPSELGALCLWFIRNCSPLALTGSLMRVDSSAAQGLCLACSGAPHSTDPLAGHISSGFPINIVESLPLSTLLHCLSDCHDAALAFLLDLTTTVENAIASELTGRVSQCRYRFFNSEVLPQYSFLLGSLCSALWQQAQAKIFAASDGIRLLVNASWRVFLLNVLSLTDPALDKTHAYECAHPPMPILQS